jgi:hypothetical protein
MSNPDVHLERVAPGLAPGEIVVRVCTPDQLLAEYSIARDPEVIAAASRRLRWQLIATAEEVVYIYFYDGTDGAHLKTIVCRSRPAITSPGVLEKLLED